MKSSVKELVTVHPQTVAQMTCRRKEPHRDASLVYVHGEFEDHRYCILGLLYSYAHERAQDNGLMLRLAELAREFRDNN
ncbi:type II toxin-antitoxin system YafO family toxin [Modicisalibacter zincidurans]|uniref:type II toxin-antitoxin system YafO family toxin n=1 Tax=Halomonadaceae TaxID=28256 RepID=UPI001237188A|nr:type II toxin-antitoxin system YafO family toxin [Halomonas sp. IOP_31]